MSNNKYGWDESFVIDFSMQNGRSKTAVSTRRYLSQMEHMYFDKTTAHKMAEREDRLVYEFYELGCPEREGDLAFGTTILYPGTVGEEYFMTKGHFHTKLETAEVYYTFQGEGYMVMENMAGHTVERQIKAGQAVYVPRGYAHRTVNTGDIPLVLFYTFAADAGHDYGTIEKKGYHKLILKRNGIPVIADNPNWQ